MNKRKIILCSIISLLCLSVGAINIYALTPTYNGKAEKGVGNTTIYIDSITGANYWETYMKSGANNWMYPGWSNPIYITFVSSNYGSTIDFYANDGSLWDGVGWTVFAETIFYRYEQEFNPIDTNWNWTFSEITLNDTEFRKPTFSNEQAKGTVIHELGHSFGLQHDNNNRYSIMCQSTSRLVETVQKVDNDAIVAKYQ
ncbi:matrixin family metalloprotease [Anaerorhabdus sp.]|uniref:matrixin family metalloprotease n=1 Tax=Anaerorhabdus sp. TaxID=1872524 RepID=UPI002FC85388